MSTCMAHSRCRAMTLDNLGRKRAATVIHAGEICERCAEHARLSTLNLTGTYHRLHAILGDHELVEVSVMRAKSPVGSEVPINVHVEAKMSAIAALLDAAVYVTNTQPVRRMSERRRVERESHWLYTNFDKLLSRPSTIVPCWRDDTFGSLVWSGHEMALALWMLNRSAARLLGERPEDMRRTYLALCPRCGEQALGRDYGSDVITCAACPPGTPGWTEAEYTRLAGWVIWERNMELEEARERIVELERKLSRVRTVATADVSEVPSALLQDLLLQILDGQHG